MNDITHIILTHGEEQVFELIRLIQKHKDKEDKLWILNDPTTPEYEKKLKLAGVHVINHSLVKNYSDHRNYALDRVKTKYVWFHDADEIPTVKLLTEIKKIIMMADEPDLIWIPRLNIFKGVQPIHALICNWTLQGEICNYPDPQTRIVKTRKGIKFVGRLHERLKATKNHKVLQLPYNQDLI
jgi:glycosyltransferase involved in cell wall biosynthesis